MGRDVGGGCLELERGRLGCDGFFPLFLSYSRHHFPMQNFENMAERISSDMLVPMIFPSSLRA